MTSQARHPHDEFADAVKAFVAFTNQTAGTTRVYVAHGAVAHLLASTASPNSGYPCCIRCSRQPTWGSCWYGTGSQTEIEKANALPLCSTRGHPQATGR